MDHSVMTLTVSLEVASNDYPIHADINHCHLRGLSNEGCKATLSCVLGLGLKSCEVGIHCSCFAESSKEDVYDSNTCSLAEWAC